MHTACDGLLEDLEAEEKGYNISGKTDHQICSSEEIDSPNTKNLIQQEKAPEKISDTQSSKTSYCIRLLD
jgi:hypothetical protein